MENKNAINTSNLLVNTGWLLTLLRLTQIIQTQWSSIFKYWLVLACIFAAELVVLGLAGWVKWLWGRVNK